MEKKKSIELIFTLVLIIIFIFLLINLTKKNRVTKKELSHTQIKEEVPLSTPEKKIKERNEEIFSLQKQRAELAWGRDPFFFVKTTKSSQGSTLVLKGITLDRNNRGFAFINEDIVTVGERIDGYTVLDIQRDKVLLKKGDDTFYLGLPEEITIKNR
ncbi:MAG: hypothetical protein NC822_03995 [Candidatus Omnitrophica bacterium]|nr:hypothetical protein [Candidatus Omnitrophota bacterium]MCM8826536.1 hypothetical protein [Candidatus Omnitrophota bacterium]